MLGSLKTRSLDTRDPERWTNTQSAIRWTKDSSGGAFRRYAGLEKRYMLAQGIEDFVCTAAYRCSHRSDYSYLFIYFYLMEVMQ